ncbi:DUF4234 domain-containing protein [Oribacterium sp. WCC10]|uniref:DUF4234 domain-containing protein n=1 Tax=Oribacterium sp. WCC10 TaxID=1855343 RepID=UPI000B881A6B|nr:DUF4234 domain-containing protein [Oribacterium sp. WCC10]
MFCKKCGNQLADDAKFCPVCGEQVNSINNFKEFSQGAYNAANSALNKAENELGDAARNIAGNNGGYYGGERLKEDRSLLMYILLTIVTCGIYSYYFVYKLAQDVNTACNGDGQETAGLVKYILLSVITCGIYSFYWQYCLGNRLASNAYRYNLAFQENGTTVLMWDLFGILLCGIGPFIAMNILINNTNKICAAYNRSNGL